MYIGECSECVIGPFPILPKVLKVKTTYRMAPSYCAFTCGAKNLSIHQRSRFPSMKGKFSQRTWISQICTGPCIHSPVRMTFPSTLAQTLTEGWQHYLCVSSASRRCLQRWITCGTVTQGGAHHAASVYTAGAIVRTRNDRRLSAWINVHSWYPAVWKDHRRWAGDTPAACSHVGSGQDGNINTFYINSHWRLYQDKLVTFHGNVMTLHS